MYPNSLLELELHRLRVEELERKLARERHQPRQARPYWQRLRSALRLRDNHRQRRELKLGRSAA